MCVITLLGEIALTRLGTGLGCEIAMTFDRQKQTQTLFLSVGFHILGETLVQIEMLT